MKTHYFVLLAAIYLSRLVSERVAKLAAIAFTVAAFVSAAEEFQWITSLFA